MKNLKLKNIALLCTLSLVLTTGCQSKSQEYSIKEEKQVEEKTNQNTNIDNEKKENTPSEKEEITKETTENIETFDNFETEKKELNDYINAKNYELAKEKGKEYFIKGIDFIFYDEEYKGITFNELEETAKETTYNNLLIIDDYIMKIYPDYKEQLSEKYNIATTFLSEKYYKVLDKIKEKIGEDNYNSIKDVKDHIKNDLNNAKDKTKEKVHDWYQNFKNS